MRHSRLHSLPGYIVLLLLLCLGSYQPSSAAPAERQSQPQTVVKSNTRLVVVNVVATDNQGVPVPDLSPQDFTLLENGKPQQISSFNFLQAGKTSQEDPLPANVFSNVPLQKASSLNIILLDELNGEFTGRAHALEELVKYLDGGPAVQPTAVYVLETKLKLLHDFSTDTKSLKAALSGFKPKVANTMDTVYMAASPFTQKGDMQTHPVHIDETLAALNSLAQVLAGYPGRKNLIWLSEAFPVNLFPDALTSTTMAFLTGRSSITHTSGAASAASGLDPAPAQALDAPQVSGGNYDDYQAAIEKLADALMDAQVAVYPIDAAGVGKISRLYSLSTMRQMAERTGGKTFANQNEMLSSIRSSIDDGSTYYTLAYYPDNKTWDGKFRQIAVKTTRPGTNLRYRIGYYALDTAAVSKADPKKTKEQFSHALALDSPNATAVLFRAVLASPADNAQRVVVNFAIDPHTLSYISKPDGVQEANLGCAVVVFSEKGSLLKDAVNNMSAPVRPSEYPKLMNSTFPCRATIDLKPGKYTLRVGVWDHNSNAMGTTTAYVTVP